MISVWIERLADRAIRVAHAHDGLEQVASHLRAHRRGADETDISGDYWHATDVWLTQLDRMSHSTDVLAWCLLQAVACYVAADRLPAHEGP